MTNDPRPVSSDVHGSPASSAGLAQFVDWGGLVWLRQVSAGVAWLGPLAGLRILDLGTRHGGMATFLALQGATVTGLDVSDDTFAAARARARDHGVADRVDFQTYSGLLADLPGGFDVVFAKSTLVLMGNAEALGRRLRTMLKPDGRLLAIENARGPLPVQIVRAAVRRRWRPYGASYLTRDSVRALTAGFDVELEHWTSMPPTVLIGARRRASSV